MTLAEQIAWSHGEAVIARQVAADLRPVLGDSARRFTERAVALEAIVTTLRRLAEPHVDEVSGAVMSASCGGRF